MKSKKAKIIYFLCFVFLIVGITFFLLRYFKRSEIKNIINQEVTIELGELVTMEDILKEPIENVEIDTDLSLLNQVGEYSVKVTIKNETFVSKIKIQDTKAPIVEAHDLIMYIDEELPKATDFITKIEELSDFAVEDIKIEKNIGRQQVEIIVIDKYGNKGSATAFLTMNEDIDPPKFDGLSFITVEIGDSVNLYDNVSAFDQRFGKVSFNVDDSEVNYRIPGTYNIYYTAEDNLGNKAKEIRKIEIKEKEITYMINNFPTFHQYPDYPNGCESAALYNLLKYYKVDVTIDQIINTLKKGDGVHWEGDILYGGNPEIEFVGDPRDIHGYGVYQKPIIDVANQFKSGIIDYTGHSLNDVLNLVKEGIPVQVWASIKLRDTNVCVSWIDKSTGNKIDWLCNLHSIVIVGYNNKSVFVSDSDTGHIEEYNKIQFEKMYNLFGKRAIYYSK